MHTRLQFRQAVRGSCQSVLFRYQEGDCLLVLRPLVPGFVQLPLRDPQSILEIRSSAQRVPETIVKSLPR